MHLLANVSRQYRTLEPGVVPVQPAEDWFAAPPEHSSRFLPVYGQISLALQAAMRRAIRHALDTNPQLAPEAVLPAHVYLAGKIFQPKSKTEIAWDAMNPATIARFFRSTAEKFPAEIEALQPRVAALNLAAMSVYFRPERARKLFESVRDRKAPHRAPASPSLRVRPNRIGPIPRHPPSL